MGKLTERQIFILNKAIEFIKEVGEQLMDWETKGYDGCEFDAFTLADDLRIEFMLDSQNN